MERIYAFFTPRKIQSIGNGILALITLVTVLPIVFMIVYILYMGLPAVNFEFIFGFPKDGLRAGGIFPAILGTFLLVMGVTLFAIPPAIAAAVYLAEYAPDNRWTKMIRIAMVNLAGIPSIVYGLFGLGLFVLFFKFGISILAASLTLAIMTLPVVISTSEEALRSVPGSFRLVSIALGASQWQTIWRIILPQSIPGIMTGAILGLERAAGETAPILFTGAAVFLPRLPTSPFSPTMALPYHLYVVTTQVPGMPSAIQYGTVLILLVIVLSLNIIATIIRSRARAKRQW